MARPCPAARRGRDLLLKAAQAGALVYRPRKS